MFPSSFLLIHVLFFFSFTKHSLGCVISIALGLVYEHEPFYAHKTHCFSKKKKKKLYIRSKSNSRELTNKIPSIAKEKLKNTIKKEFELVPCH